MPFCKQHNNSGSTAVCVLLDEYKIHVAWLGDSQVLLVRDGAAVPLMVPHKPEREVILPSRSSNIVFVIMVPRYPVQPPSTQICVMALYKTG